MYLDFKPLFDAALKEDPEAGRQLQQVKQLFDFEKLGPGRGGVSSRTASGSPWTSA
jgi:hypothetical protein